MSDTEQARVWLRENGYADIADLIDEIISEWEKTGNRTRRNWWDILSGDKHGRPRFVAGRRFPVLRAAQIRQGKPISKNAISRSGEEEKQKTWQPARWSNYTPKKSKEKE